MIFSLVIMGVVAILQAYILLPDHSGGALKDQYHRLRQLESLAQIDSQNDTPVDDGESLSSRSGESKTFVYTLQQYMSTRGTVLNFILDPFGRVDFNCKAQLVGLCVATNFQMRLII